jgi:hypothetical protein
MCSENQEKDSSEREQTRQQITRKTPCNDKLGYILKLLDFVNVRIYGLFEEYQ